jgi:hypothetical protein
MGILTLEKENMALLNLAREPFLGMEILAKKL